MTPRVLIRFLLASDIGKRLLVRMWTKSLVKSQWWSRERIDALALERARDIMQHASHIPFWTERFARAGTRSETFTLDELAKLPLLTKDDFRYSDAALYLDQSLLHMSYLEKTSGSTGTPFGFHHDNEYALRSCAVRDRHRHNVGGGSSCHIIFLRGRDRRAFAHSNFTFFVLKNADLARYRFDELAAQAEYHSGNVILHGLTSLLVALAIEQETRTTRIPLRAIVVSGEELSPENRKRIENAFGVKTYISYGMNEVGQTAFMCEQNRLHVNEEWVYLEILDEKGLRKPHGETGRVVATSFFNKIMPLIRYDTGDLGRFHTDACPCGRTLRTIEMRGRSLHMLKLPEGRTLSAYSLCAVLDGRTEAIRRYQIIWHGEYSFHIRVVPTGHFKQSQESITDTLQRIIHPASHVQWECVDAIAPGPDGKAVYFVDASNTPLAR